MGKAKKPAVSVTPPYVQNQIDHLRNELEQVNDRLDAAILSQTTRSDNISDRHNYLTDSVDKLQAFVYKRDEVLTRLAQYVSNTDDAAFLPTRGHSTLGNLDSQLGNLRQLFNELYGLNWNQSQRERIAALKSLRQPKDAEPAKGAAAPEDHNGSWYNRNYVKDLEDKVAKLSWYNVEQAKCIQDLRGELRGADEVITGLRKQVATTTDSAVANRVREQAREILDLRQCNDNQRGHIEDLQKRLADILKVVNKQ